VEDKIVETMSDDDLRLLAQQIERDREMSTGELNPVEMEEN
jgi:hypothetical protein